MDTSKQLNFDAYSKYVKFIQWNGTHQNYESEKIYTDFKKGRNTPKASSDRNDNHSIIFSTPENHTV